MMADPLLKPAQPKGFGLTDTGGTLRPLQRPSARLPATPATPGFATPGWFECAVDSFRYLLSPVDSPSRRSASCSLETLTRRTSAWQYYALILWHRGSLIRPAVELCRSCIALEISSISTYILPDIAAAMQSALSPSSIFLSIIPRIFSCGVALMFGADRIYQHIEIVCLAAIQDSWRFSHGADMWGLGFKLPPAPFHIRTARRL